MNNDTILVTGGAGFVGSNIVKYLNQNGFSKIIIIDAYSDLKYKNLSNLSFMHFIDLRSGRSNVIKELYNFKISVIFHVGANADVLENNPQIMFEENYLYSIDLPRLFYHKMRWRPC